RKLVLRPGHGVTRQRRHAGHHACDCRGHQHFSGGESARSKSSVHFFCSVTFVRLFIIPMARIQDSGSGRGCTVSAFELPASFSIFLATGTGSGFGGGLESSAALGVASV